MADEFMRDNLRQSKPIRHVSRRIAKDKVKIVTRRCLADKN
jgi:hypothetical protein